MNLRIIITSCALAIALIAAGDAKAQRADSGDTAVALLRALAEAEQDYFSRAGQIVRLRLFYESRGDETKVAETDAAEALVEEAYVARLDELRSQYGARAVQDAQDARQTAKRSGRNNSGKNNPKNNAKNNPDKGNDSPDRGKNNSKNNPKNNAKHNPDKGNDSPDRGKNNSKNNPKNNAKNNPDKGNDSPDRGKNNSKNDPKNNAKNNPDKGNDSPDRGKNNSKNDPKNNAKNNPDKGKGSPNRGKNNSTDNTDKDDDDRDRDDRDDDYDESGEYDREWSQMEAEYEREMAQIQAEYDREMRQIEREVDRDLAEADREGKPEKVRAAHAKFERKRDRLIAKAEEKHRARAAWLENKMIAFQEREKVAICWSPTGDPEDRRTRIVTRATLDAYLDLGATLGGCDEPAGIDMPEPRWRPSPIVRPDESPEGIAPQTPPIDPAETVYEEILKRVPVVLGDGKTGEILDVILRKPAPTQAEADRLLDQLLRGR